MDDIDKDLRDALHHIDVVLDDTKKLRHASYDSISYPNFGGAGFALMASEAIAMIVFGWPKDGTDGEDGRTAVFKLWNRHFPPEYYKYREFIWYTFRNKILHIYKPTKVLGIDVPESDDSFLTGVSWNSGRDEHLKVRWHNERQRPYFGFDVCSYLDDLTIAVEQIRSSSGNRKIMYGILQGWSGLGESMRIQKEDCQSGELLKEIEILEREVSKICKANRADSKHREDALLPSPEIPDDER